MDMLTACKKALNKIAKKQKLSDMEIRIDDFSNRHYRISTSNMSKFTVLEHYKQDSELNFRFCSDDSAPDGYYHELVVYLRENDDSTRSVSVTITAPIHPEKSANHIDILNGVLIKKHKESLVDMLVSLYEVVDEFFGDLDYNPSFDYHDYVDKYNFISDYLIECNYVTID